MRVHARSVLAEQRLRHERRVVPVPGGDLLHDEPVRDRVVGHRERVRIAHVDLVLRGPDLVVVVLDRDPARLERGDGVVPHLGRRVLRGHCEVPALVDRLRALVVLEHEVLELRADVERVEAHSLHPLERTPERVPGIALVWRPVGRHDVADHARDLRPDRMPMLVERARHELVRGGVGDRDHVRLLDRVEARDRRAVEAHPVVQRVLHLGRRDRERLQMPFEVREPEQDVLDALVLDALEHGAPRRHGRRRPVAAPHHARARACSIACCCSSVLPSDLLGKRKKTPDEATSWLRATR